jgi:SAM-dependent methyltransferase
MKNSSSYGNLSSWFYDIDKPSPNEKELQFYLSYANKNMNILEPMCGSGKFLAVFIERGFNIDGFDLSKEMLEKCIAKVEKLKTKNNNILQCCSFKDFSSNKKYDYIFIPSGSFSLIINSSDIVESIKTIERLSNKNGKILMELEINENIKEYTTSEMYTKNRVVKNNNIEIALFNKIIEIDEVENIVAWMLKYELYENGKYVQEEEENYIIKNYKPDEFEKYIGGTSLKIENKYINYEKEKYINQKTDKIIYEIKK